MRLYEGWRSSASWRARLALALKRIAYDSVLLEDAPEYRTALTGINPLRAVPTLVLDDGRVLTDSVAIIEWLDETHPEPPLLPADPWERARVRELVQLITSGVHPLQNTQIQQAVAPDDEAAQRAWCARWIKRGLEAYEQHLRDETGRFSRGDRLTMADVYLVPQVRNAERHGADLSGCPRVQQIYATCMELPEVQATDPVAVRKRGS
jgi:maleylacetoacetate isomerase